MRIERSGSGEVKWFWAEESDFQRMVQRGEGLCLSCGAVQKVEFEDDCDERCEKCGKREVGGSYFLLRVGRLLVLEQERPE
jgi:hypothetical protein